MHQLVITYDREIAIETGLIIFWVVLTILSIVNWYRSHLIFKEMQKVYKQLQVAADNFYETIKTKKN